MHEFVCKFVYLGEKEFGECIDVDNGKIIVKFRDKFYAVPMDKVERVERDRVVLREFDKRKAEKDGTKWIEEKSKPVTLEELKKYGFED